MVEATIESKEALLFCYTKLVDTVILFYIQIIESDLMLSTGFAQSTTILAWHILVESEYLFSKRVNPSHTACTGF